MTNLKLVLRTYSALRQMSPDDIALLETLRALNDGDRELMVETLQGKATGKKAGKKTSSSTSKSSQPSSKSPRASGMAAQLKERRQQRGTPDDSDDDNRFDGKSAQDARDELLRDVTDESSERCMFPRGDRQWCYLLSDHNVHHMKTHPEYHPFQPSTTAPPAPAPLPANGASSASERNTRRSAPPSMPESGNGEERSALLSAQNSEASAVTAGAATGGSSDG